MSEIDIIINEKNNLINDLKRTIEDQNKRFSENQQKINKLISKKSAAMEVYSRLNKIKILSWMAVIAPVPVSMVSSVNFFAGGIIAVGVAAASIIIAKKEVFLEISRLESKYGLKK